MVIRGGFRETAQHDACDPARGSRQFRSDRAHGDARGAIGRKAINAGRYGRKRKRRQPIRRGQIKRRAIARGQQFVFARAASAPYRTDSVDHVLGRQPVAFRDLGFSGWTTTESPAIASYASLEAMTIGKTVAIQATVPKVPLL